MFVAARKPFVILYILAILLLLSPLSANPAQAAATFVKGINMNGSAVTIDGNVWLSYADAKTSGFSTTATKTFSSNITWSPAVDSATNTMLNTVIYQSGSSFTMTQTIANGTYDVYFWLTENYANNARKVDIKVEGATVASGVGAMNKNTWVKYGPYAATVTDGALNVDFIRISGDPQVAGMAIFTNGNSTTPRTFTPTNTLTITNTPTPGQKYRIIVSADYAVSGPLDIDEPNPEGVQSMVRFLMHSNEFDVEALVASAATNANVTRKNDILYTIDKYDLVDENLRQHDPDYPTADALRAVTYRGLGTDDGINITWGCGNNWQGIIGAGRDSEASNAIIAIVDKPDPRPVWISVWGGTREVAQAIWKVQQTRSPAELNLFLSKLRIYMISCQDASNSWLVNNFPNLFMIQSTSTYRGMACNGGDTSLCNLNWVNTNIRNNHGPLGANYPSAGCCGMGVQEVDSPSFMHLISAAQGLNNPEDPTQPSWGGQYVRSGTTNHWVDGLGESTISQWRADFQREFAMRADWNLPALWIETPTPPQPTNTPTVTPSKTNTPTATATPLPSQVVFAANAGGPAFTAADGTAFAADKNFSGGSTYSKVVAINGTIDDTLYQSERYGNFSYAVPVSNGNYKVTLSFAEVYQTQAGKRIFDVLMEGTERISNLDIYAQVGANTAYNTETVVTVSDGTLNIRFVSNVENAKVNAIKVSPTVTGQTHTPTNTGTPTNTPGTPSSTLPSSYQWGSSGVLISPKPDSSHSLKGIKDPSVVYSGGKWHVFASTASEAQGYNMVYMNFTDWSQAASATHYYLDQSPIGAGYRAAPEVFYFAPQNLWYLIYQTGNASYSTNPDISNPNGWSAPKHFYSGMPAIIQQNIGSGYWVDMWVICDSANCYLFSSDDNGHLYRSQTPLSNFPNGMSQPVIAMQDSNKANLYEASNVYKVQGRNQYLMLIEAIGSDGRRWFRSWTSSSIAGPWTALADTESNPFMRSNNVTFSGAAWTRDFSHGEMIRAGTDQTLTISPCNIRYLYQGMDPNASASYNDLPWRLALVTQSNSTCTSP